MRFMRLLLCISISSLISSAIAFDEYGHSKHGSAFDSGMRTKPWVMEGIGKTHFPISSKNAEVQKWFDQGNSLLHNFWFEEAERSFRWCLKLDPDCAMAYWSLARCGFNWFTIGIKEHGKDQERYTQFLKEAVKRKSKVSARERMYIEAWADAFAPDEKEREKMMVRRLQAIVLAYPDDIEAKALLALFNIGQGSGYANELIVQQVLAKNPLHPGAHHASIHNWDGGSAVQAIRSCEMYGKAAPGAGHAQHMPGHIYSKIGMWHEAARAMDAATRTELRYMNERLALPFETWNYAHNRNYLCYIQEQLGMAEVSIQGARDLIAAPNDPEYNPADFGMGAEGLFALTRALVKFERWDEILKPGSLPWKEKAEGEEKMLRGLIETLAYIGKGKLVEARDSFTELKAGIAKAPSGGKEEDPFRTMPINVAEGLLLIAEGNTLDGQRLLMEGAAKEQKMRDMESYPNDPAAFAWPIMRLVGDLHLGRGDARLAIEAYERALKNEPNDGFSLAGLTKAHHALGHKQEAEKYYGRFLYVWSGADAGLKWTQELKALGIKAAPLAETPAPERPYRPADLKSYGPSNWEPFAAPKLQCLDSDGKSVQLEDYKGKNVLLVFYLSDECVHCVEQLVGINNSMSDFEKENTVVLAVSSATPEKNKDSQKLGKLGIRLLSDKNHENARRYASYDDFEELELHSTILIDPQGRVRWKRTGGDPFKNTEFLLKELGRVNAEAQASSGKR